MAKKKRRFGGFFRRRSPAARVASAAPAPRKRRAREALGGLGRALMSVGVPALGAAALAMAEKDGDTYAPENAPTVGDVDPGLLYGAVAGVVVPAVLRGRAGRFIGQAGVGAFSVGVHRSIQRGSIQLDADEEAGVPAESEG